VDSLTQYLVEQKQREGGVTKNLMACHKKNLKTDTKIAKRAARATRWYRAALKFRDALETWDERSPTPKFEVAK
jgi:hypothetical protein